MTRRKVKLAYIQDQADRKASYKKRKKGLMKKVEELSTLCGVDACAIIYSPFEDEPEAWPQDPEEMRRILSRFNNLPEVEKLKRMVNQEGFTRSRIEKLKDQIKKQARENREKEVSGMIYKCLGGETLENYGASDLNDMSWLIQKNLKEISRRLELGKNFACQEALLPPPPRGVEAGPLLLDQTSGVYYGGGDHVHGLSDSASSSNVVAAAVGLGAGAGAGGAPPPEILPADGHQVMHNLACEMSRLTTGDSLPDYFPDFGSDQFWFPSLFSKHDGAAPSHIGGGGFGSARPGHIGGGFGGAGPSHGGAYGGGAGPGNI